jgi:hypothetical protein
MKQKKIYKQETKETGQDTNDTEQRTVQGTWTGDHVQNGNLMVCKK